MRILVTGHRGYIGTVLVPMLVASKHDVVGLDSDLFRRCTFTDGMVDIPQLRKDIRDIEQTDVEGFDAVIHLAGLSNDPLGDLNPEYTFEINHRASVRLARMAKESGVRRFVFSSSCSNYGAGGDDWLTEESPFNPVTPYGRSKVLVEQDVSKLASDHFAPTFLRNATAFGVSPRLRFDLVLNNLVAWAFTTGKVFIKSDGTPWRPIIHVEDISRAFLAILHSPVEKIHNQAFNVCRTEDNYRIHELADIVKETVPGCEIAYAENASPDKRNYRVDGSKITRMVPEFRPQWNARKGAQQLVEAYRRIGLRLDDFEGVRFKRIDHIRHLIKTNIIEDSMRWKDEEFITVET